MINTADELIVKTTGDMNVIDVQRKPAPLTKRCENCKKIYPITEFNKHKLGKDGYGRFCSQCRSKLELTRRPHVIATIPPQPEPNLTIQTMTMGLETAPTPQPTPQPNPSPQDDLVTVTLWLTETLKALPTPQQRQLLLQLLLVLP